MTTELEIIANYVMTMGIRTLILSPANLSSIVSGIEIASPSKSIVSFPHEDNEHMEVESHFQ
jgi:hypothetical protein